jgi:hypothetical protein
MSEITLDKTDFYEIATEILGKGGSFRFRARGGSMYPFIRDGAVITVGPVRLRRLRVGDVVLYGNQAGMVVHRIIAKKTLDERVHLWIRGDASSGSGERVLSSWVKGRVEKIEQREKIMRPNQGFWRWAGIFWVSLTPFIQLLLRLIIYCRGAINRTTRCYP